MSQQIQITGGAKVRDLQDVIIGTSGVLSSLAFNVANGVPKLDSNGKILVAQLPNSVMEYLGTWNATTNTPTLVNGTGNQGDVYLCNVAGTVNFGAGPIAFVVGDQVIYSGTIWQRASGATGTVTSVAITESGDSLNITGSPITTSGTINIGFNGTNLQYVNGAGNLTTFPDLSVYVTLAGTQTITGAKTFGIAKFDGGIYLKDSAITSIISGYTAIGSVTGGIYISLNGSIYQSTLAFNSAADFTYQFPSASGTIALTSDIPILTGYVPYTGATQDVDLGAFKLNAQSLHIKGTGGLGHLGLKHQSASATAAANEVSLFADSLGDLGWLNGNLYLSKFITSGNTAARSYTFPNATCNIPDDSLVVHLAGTETITGAKTFSGGVTFSSSVTTNNLTFANSGFFLTLQPPTLSVNRTVTFADITGTIAMLEGTQTFTGYKTFDAALELKYNVIPTPSSAGNIGIGSNGVGITITTKPVSTVYNNNLYFASASNTFTFPNATGTIALVGGSGVGTVTSVAALTLGTSGTDLSSTVANSTTTPVITLNIPTASASNRGALSSTDWTTFNNKQNALTNPVTGTGTTNYLPKFTGASTIGNSIVQDNGSTVTIGGSLTLTASSGFPSVGLLNRSSDTTLYMVSPASGFTLTDSSLNTIYNATPTSHNWNISNALKMKLDASGNLGLGVTPSAWSTSFGIKVIDTGSKGTFYASDNDANVSFNQYFDGTNAVYKTTGTASRLALVGNEFQFRIAPSGTAGNAITFTQAMTLTAAGNLGIGTSTPDRKLSVHSSGAGVEAARFTDNNRADLIIGFPSDGVAMITAEYGTAGTLAFGSGTTRTERMRITSGGNVGIGSSNTDPLSLARDRNLAIVTTGTNAALTIVGGGAARIDFGVGSTRTGGIYSDSTNFMEIFTSTALPIVFSPNATQAMRITSGGNVGIGTTPSARLEVKQANSLDYRGLLVVDSATPNWIGLAHTGSAGVISVLYDGAGSYTPMVFKTSDTERMRITSGGNIGIGVTSPNQKVEIQATANIWATRFIGANVTGQSYGFYVDAGTNTSDTCVLLRSNGGSTEYMWIRGDGLTYMRGNVLIGTTDNTSNTKLVLYSTTAATQIKAAGTAPAITFSNTITSPTIGGSLGACTSAGQFLSGTAAGDMILINQFTGNKLYITNYSGGVYLTQGATSWTANSDIRLKNINSHIENAVEKLSTLQTINFSYKDDKFKKQNLGLIAQEVEKIFPELIDKNGDGMLGVRYTELVPVLIKAVQELKAEIETLKNK